jgi:hypothetical protein
MVHGRSNACRRLAGDVNRRPVSFSRRRPQAGQAVLVRHKLPCPVEIAPSGLEPIWQVSHRDGRKGAEGTQLGEYPCRADRSVTVGSHPAGDGCASFLRRTRVEGDTRSVSDEDAFYSP